MTTKKEVPTHMMRLAASSIEKYMSVAVYGGLTAITCVLPVFWCIPLVIGLSVSLGIILTKTPKYNHLTTQADGSLLLEDRAGKRRVVHIQQESVVYPFLIILFIRHEYKEAILLWPDSAESSALRHLRIWLYWYWPTISFSVKKH